jgi:hypothetical protein
MRYAVRQKEFASSAYHFDNAFIDWTGDLDVR